MVNALRLFKNPQFFSSNELSDAAARESSLKSILKGKRYKLSPDILTRRTLLNEIDETLSELRYARACFENASDPEIVEASVYKIKSAEARYNYLLRKAKESNISRKTYEF